MPASQRSLRLTDAYRDRLLAIRAKLERDIRRSWPDIDGLDGARAAWAALAAEMVSRAQREAVRLTAGYLTAFISSELDRRVRLIPIEADPYLVSRDGRELREALESPIIATLAALKTEGAGQALGAGLRRALLMTGLDVDYAAQHSLFDGMAADSRIIGWRRALSGTCGACMADTRTFVRDVGEPMLRHPNCKCVAEPGVKGFKQREQFPRPSGDQIFAAMTAAHQDAAVGPIVADRIRRGDIRLTDLIAFDQMAMGENFITQGAALETN